MPMAGLPGRLRAGDDGLQPLQQVVAAGLLARHADRAGRGRVGDGQRISRRHLRQGAPLGARRQRGARAQSIGTSRGGPTTKIHVVADVLGRPAVIHLTPGNASDVTVAPEAVAAVPGRPSAWSPTADTTPTRSGAPSRRAGRPRSSRGDATASARSATTKPATRIVGASRPPSAASRTSDASRPATTSSPPP